MLFDEIKRLKEEIAEKEKEEQKEMEQLEEIEEEIEEEVKEEKEEKEEQKEEKTEIKEEKKEEELDNAGYARLRREAAAEKRRAEQLEKELEGLRKAKEPQEDEEERAEQIQLPPEIQDVVERHRRDNAEEEFLAFEGQVRTSHTDASAVLNEYAAAMYQSIKIQNPRKSEIELNKMTKNAILMQAGEYARKGHENPVEEMYHIAKELGYAGKSFQKEDKIESKEEKIIPDLRKVAENRKRSTGMTANNGRSEGMMTAGAAADLTTAEWAKLPTAEKRRLLYPNQG